MGKQTGEEKGAVRKPNAGWFTKGHQHAGPGRGHKKPGNEFGFDPIADLLHVYRTKDYGIKNDDTPGQAAARKLLKDDYKSFMQLLLRGQGLVEAASSQDEVGVQEDRVEELCEQLLREWEESQ